MSTVDVEGVVAIARPSSGRVSAIVDRLATPVDIASLVFFRVCLGLILAWEAWGFLRLGLVKSYWIDPAFHFTFLGFGWVQPWPGVGMYVHFFVLVGLALCIAAGLFYRAATILFFLAFAYVLLLDKAYYLNHFYLITLISFLLMFVPAHRAFSLDAIRNPKIRSETTPAWAVWALSAQLAIAYFFGGVAKIKWDWLVLGEPMRTYLAALAAPNGIPVAGPLIGTETAVYVFAWGGMLFDLAIPFLLWCPRTRVVAYLAVVGFHLCNALLFDIGIFPWFMICASTLFLSPDWPRRFGLPRVLVPRERQRTPTSERAFGLGSLGFGQRAILGLLALHFVVQLIVPFAHHLYPSYVLWSREPGYFIWHMKMATIATEMRMVARDSATGEEREINPRLHLNAKQARKLPTEPDMLVQYAHFLADQAKRRGYSIEVRAHIRSALNRRTPRLFVDPEVNLAAVSRSMGPAPFIYPLEEAPLAEGPFAGDASQAAQEELVAGE